MKIIWRRAALADVGAAILYIAADKPGVAVEVPRRIRGVEPLLTMWPEIGRWINDASHSRSRTPYFVIDEIRAGVIVITGVVHGRQNRR